MVEKKLINVFEEHILFTKFLVSVLTDNEKE